MSVIRNGCYFLVCLLLLSCTAGGGLSPVVEKRPAFTTLQLRAKLALLPAAQLAAGEELLVRYPVGRLFTQFSVLPLSQGTEPLDALARLIKQAGGIWRLKVRAATGEGQKYDAKIAAERVRILRTYLRNSGVGSQRISFEAVTEPGAPLEISMTQ